MRLQETINDLETFSYSITHDMRAPLRAMQGFSKLLIEAYGEKLDAEALDYLQRIANASNRLDLLIRDVLSYGNVARTQLQLMPVNVDKLLHDIIREYPGFQPPQAEIQLRGPLPEVLGNEAFLTQCFSNLLGNAVKFVKPNTVPRVEVFAERRDAMVRFQIKDNGIGIPAPYHHRLFKLFHRAQNHFPGTGVGLAIVRKAVERMGGDVGLESEVGQGSTFWVELKAARG
jgi:signal transduction histidine kinase